MNKYLIGLIIIVVIASGIYFYKSSDPNNLPEIPGAMSDVTDATLEGDAMMAKGAGSYEPYAESKLSLASEGKVVLFFRAAWCPTCRALDADIKARLSEIPQGVTILDVDYDNSGDLKKKYGVTYQHTLVQVDQSGNQLKKWSNSPTLTTLVSEIQ